MDHLVLAVAREYQKVGLPITKGEFGESYYHLIENTIFESRGTGQTMDVVEPAGSYA
jgi:hypothetical protein